MYFDYVEKKMIVKEHNEFIKLLTKISSISNSHTHSDYHKIYNMTIIHTGLLNGHKSSIQLHLWP